MPINNKLICHCSGSLSSEIFSDIRKYGAYGYSIHPMFAINDKYNSYKDLPNAFITIEGHKEYQGKLEQLFLSLGNKVQIISKENAQKVLSMMNSVVSEGTGKMQELKVIRLVEKLVLLKMVLILENMLLLFVVLQKLITLKLFY